MPSPTLRLLAPMLACALLLPACDTLPTRPRSELVQQAEQAYAQGDFARAAQDFLDAAASQRGERDRLHLRAAEAWREEGALDRAGTALDGISGKRLDPDGQQRLGLLLAEVALARGQAQAALARLDTLAPHLDPRHRARLLELRARAAEADANPFLAASARSELGELLPRGERAANRRQVQALLEQVDDHSLALAAAALPIGHALYPQAARVLLARGLSLPRPLPRTAEDAVGATDADGYRALHRIALLLPLDGALSEAAQAVRDGFIAGYLQESRARPELRIHATDGSRESTLAAWNAALGEGAQAVIGPLDRDAVAALFEAAHEGNVPIVALNRGGGVPPPPGSVGFALAPEDEGSAAANRILDRGGRRVLVVEAGDDYGQRAASALAQRLQQRGGRVVASLRLPADNPNFSAAINAALQQAGVRSVLADGDTRIEQNRVAVDADAIFFTGRAAQARLFVPQLRVAGVYDLPIYATSQITAGAGNPRLDRELDGIEFTDAPWLFAGHLPGLPARSTLTGLDSTRGSSARLFAFGLDAFLIAGHLDQLLHDPQASLDGATGQLRFDGFGQIVRTPAWARFQGGRIQPAREAGLIGDEIQFEP